MKKSDATYRNKKRQKSEKEFATTLKKGISIGGETGGGGGGPWPHPHFFREGAWGVPNLRDFFSKITLLKNVFAT